MGGPAQYHLSTFPVWEYGSSFNCLAWGKGDHWSRNLKADSPLYSLHSRMRKEGYAWHFSWVFPERKAELSSHCEPGARLSKNYLFCTGWTSDWDSHAAEPCPPPPSVPSSPTVVIAAKGQRQMYGSGPQATFWMLFFKYGTCRCLSKEAWTGIWNHKQIS